MAAVKFGKPYTDQDGYRRADSKCGRYFVRAGGSNCWFAYRTEDGSCVDGSHPCDLTVAKLQCTADANPDNRILSCRNAVRHARLRKRGEGCSLCGFNQVGPFPPRKEDTR